MYILYDLLIYKMHLFGVRVCTFRLSQLHRIESGIDVFGMSTAIK